MQVKESAFSLHSHGSSLTPSRCANRRCCLKFHIVHTSTPHRGLGLDVLTGSNLSVHDHSACRGVASQNRFPGPYPHRPPAKDISLQQYKGQKTHNCIFSFLVCSQIFNGAGTTVRRSQPSHVCHFAWLPSALDSLHKISQVSGSKLGHVT